MKTAICLLAFGLVWPAAAQVGENASPKDGVVHGRLVAGPNDQGVAEAVVLLSGSSDASGDNSRPERILEHARTDDQGGFRFNGLPNGHYSIQASKAGYRLENDSSGSVRLEGEEAQGRVEVRLVRKPILTGTVFDADGRPLSNAQVVLLRRTTDNGELGLQQAQTVSADDRGEFRLALDEADWFWLKAHHMEPSFAYGPNPRPTGVVFYPNSPDLRTARPVPLSFDQPERRIDLVLPWAPQTHLVSVIFSGRQNRPCYACFWNLYRVEGPLQYEVASGGTGPDGAMDLRGIPVGQYRIQAQETIAGNDTPWVAEEEVFVAEGQITEAALTTQPPAPITGRVILEDLPPDARERLRQPNQDLHISVQPVRTTTFYGRNHRANLDLDSPTFELGPFPPGTYRLSVFGSVGCYVAGIARNGRRLSTPEIDLRQQGASGDLEVRVRFDSAHFQGRLTAAGESAMHPWNLVLMPDLGHPFGSEGSGWCSPNGRCEAGGLVPGVYQAWAIPMQTQGLRDPAMRERLQPWATEVRLAPGPNPEISLRAMPLHEVEEALAIDPEKPPSLTY